MTRDEFLDVMGYISVAIGKPLGNNEKETERRLEVYFDLLGDLPLAVLRMAAKKVCLEHIWASFPNPAELRNAAALVTRGLAAEMAPAEAWELAWKATAKIDLEVEGSLDRACKDLPPLVFAAMKAYGVPSLVYGKEPVGVVRAQFLKIYEQLQQRDQKAALLPPALKAQIEANGQPPAVSMEQTFRSIGQMPE